MKKFPRGSSNGCIHAAGLSGRDWDARLASQASQLSVSDPATAAATDALQEQGGRGRGERGKAARAAAVHVRGSAGGMGGKCHLWGLRCEGGNFCWWGMSFDYEENDLLRVDEWDVGSNSRGASYNGR